MILVIHREQADMKGMFGGHRGVAFTLSTRLQFSDEERQLLDHYRMWYYPLFERGGTPVSIRQLADGETETLHVVEVLLQREEALKRALDKIPPLLDVLRSFGGDEIIEYPRSA